MIVRKLLSSLAGLAGLALASAALGACNADFSASAAHVDGATISQQRLNGTLAAIEADAAYRCVLTGATGAPVQQGAGQGTYATSFASSILTTLVEERALAATLARRHLAVGSFARTVATQALQAQLAPPQGSSCTATGPAVLAGLPASYRRFVVDLQAEQGVLMARAAGVDLTVAGMRRYGAGHPTETSLDCVSAIEVASKAKAASIAAQVQAGASFASLAKQLSIDQASAPAGGALGCVLPAQLATSLGAIVSKLSPGQVSAPVPFGSNWVLFQLTSRSPASPAQVASIVLQAEATKDSAIIVSALEGVHVRVDPLYGRWVKVSGVWQVLPPTGPPSSLLGNAAAVAPSNPSAASSLG